MNGGRVQIPAYTDWWMRGARFGEIVGAYVQSHGPHEGKEILRVKLDAAPQVVRVIADDCTFL